MAEANVQFIRTAPLPYVLSVPTAPVEPSGSHIPVLLFLHGYDEAAPAPMDQGLTRHGPLRAGNPAIAMSHFIVIAPQLPVAGDTWGRYAGSVLQILGEAFTGWNADPERVYLSGFSFGGNGVFDLALRQPTVWAALWAVDPTRVPGQDPGIPAWLSSGEVSRRRKDGFMERLQLVEGDSGAAGTRVYVDEGLDHVGTAASAYANAHIYKWLLGHERRARPEDAE